MGSDEAIPPEAARGADDSSGVGPPAPPAAAHEFLYLGDLASCPHILAFEAGRLVNQPRFNLVRARIDPTDTHIEAAVRAARELSRRGRLLSPSSVGRDEFEALVVGGARDLLDSIGTEWHGEDVATFAKHYDEPWRVCEGECDPEGERRFLSDSFVSRITEVVGGIRAATPVSLDDRNRVAFLLGELLDEGLRRADIHRHLFRRVERVERTPGGQARTVERYLLTTRKPGEIPPRVSGSIGSGTACLNWA